MYFFSGGKMQHEKQHQNFAPPSFFRHLITFFTIKQSSSWYGTVWMFEYWIPLHIMDGYNWKNKQKTRIHVTAWPKQVSSCGRQWDSLNTIYGSGRSQKTNYHLLIGQPTWHDHFFSSPSPILIGCLTWSDLGSLSLSAEDEVRWGRKEADAKEHRCSLARRVVSTRTDRPGRMLENKRERLKTFLRKIDEKAIVRIKHFMRERWVRMVSRTAIYRSAGQASPNTECTNGFWLLLDNILSLKIVSGCIYLLLCTIKRNFFYMEGGKKRKEVHPSVNGVC